jgi:hypothetical protein
MIMTSERERERGERGREGKREQKCGRERMMERDGKYLNGRETSNLPVFQSTNHRLLVLR